MSQCENCQKQPAEQYVTFWAGGTLRCTPIYSEISACSDKCADAICEKREIE